MAVRSIGVGQGKTFVALLGALLVGSACSSDSSVSFDPDPDLSGAGKAGSHSSAGTGSSAGSRHSSAGTSSSAGTGSDEGGSESGGSDSSGAAGTESGGSGSEGGFGGTSAGSATGGTGTAGEAMGGRGGGTSGSGGSSSDAGSGGMAGTAGRSGEGGTGGSGSGPCTTAYYGGRSYAFCGAVDSAAAAFAKCESLNMGVVAIESKAENTYVQSKQSTTWLGGTDEGKEGEWRWASTKVLFWNEKPVQGVYSNFIDGQPSNKDDAGEPENCLLLSASGWNDVGCALGGFNVTCESSGFVGPPL